MSSTDVSDSEAVTLMNVDVERIVTGLSQSQELYASFVEMALALFLLHGEISWAALTPLGIILGFTAITLKTVAGLSASQKAWLNSIQARIDATASILGSIKLVKMSGLSSHFSYKLGNLREAEISAAGAYRKILVKIVTFCECRPPTTRD